MGLPLCRLEIVLYCLPKANCYPYVGANDEIAVWDILAKNESEINNEKKFTSR